MESANFIGIFVERLPENLYPFPLSYSKELDDLVSTIIFRLADKEEFQECRFSVRTARPDNLIGLAHALNVFLTGVGGSELMRYLNNLLQLPPICSDEFKGRWEKFMDTQRDIRGSVGEKREDEYHRNITLQDFIDRIEMVYELAIEKYTCGIENDIYKEEIDKAVELLTALDLYMIILFGEEELKELTARVNQLFEASRSAARGGERLFDALRHQLEVRGLLE